MIILSPARLHWADLGVVETSETRLARKAARLNLAVVRLCLQCGVDTSNIKPAQCLHNLHRIIQALRMHNTVRLELNTANTSGEQLDILQAQLDYEEESGSEEESEQGLLLAAEWESVSAEQVPSLHSQSSLATAVSNTVSQLLWGPSLSPATNKK